MPMVAFHTRFPDIAALQTRSITITKKGPLPRGTYTFFESFCNERGCDCRRVFLNVLSGRGKHEATIGFGWEKPAFYRRWMRGAEDEFVQTMSGVRLEPMQPQGNHADAILDLFARVLLPDKPYIKRIKRHYEMFKKSVADGPPEPESDEAPDPPGAPSLPPKVSGRNAPCPCGSGRKYKKCCMRN